MSERFVRSTVRVPLHVPAGERHRVWGLRLQQNQAFNLGVELQLNSEELVTPYTGYKLLTERRNDGRMPKHPVLVQRGGLAQGLEAVKKHQQSRFKMERKVEWWDGRDNAKFDKAYTRLEEHRDEGTQRLFRSRKDLEVENGPALVLYEGVNLKDGHIVLPGGVWLPMAKDLELEDGWEFTGAVQIVDTTTRVTAKTRPEHRTYTALLSIRKKIESSPSVASRREEVLGVDAGVVIPICTSTREHYHLPDETESQTEIERLQRLRSRNYEYGSRRWKKASREVAKAQAAQANKRINATRHLAKAVVTTSGIKEVGAEDLNLANMLASAKGTASYPGSNVAQKRGLNRSLSRTALRRLLDCIERACEIQNKSFTKVPAPYTSQTCHACGKIGVRDTQADFVCPYCGLSDNADENSAINVGDLTWERRTGQSVVRRSKKGKKKTSGDASKQCLQAATAT